MPTSPSADYPLLSDATLDKLHHLAALRRPTTDAARQTLRSGLEPMIRLAESVRTFEIDPARFEVWTGQEMEDVVDARVAPRISSSEEELEGEVEDETPGLLEGEFDGTEEVPREVLLGMAGRRMGDYFVVERSSGQRRGDE